MRRIFRGLSLLFLLIGLTSGTASRTARSASPAGLTLVSAQSHVNRIAAAAGVKLTSYVDSEEIQRLKSHGLTEALVRDAFETVMLACLSHGPTSALPIGKAPASAAEHASGPDPCGTTFGAGTKQQNEAEWLAAWLAKIADVAPGKPTATMRLFARLRARGVLFVDVEHLLRRRHQLTKVRCEPPVPEEIERAAANLNYFLILTRREVRSLSEVEKADLAYTIAVLDKSGEPVGASREDTVSPPLPAGDSVLAAHGSRQRQMKQALLGGNIEQYVAVAKADLTAFGYPGPIRIHGDGDMRWGGAGMSYTMRETALYAELLGDVNFASDLYRRANPGGGACGTSRDYEWELQVEGMIRTGEAMGQCRTVVAERLLAIDGVSENAIYGPTQLSAAGFDVERIYRGALLTLNQYVPGSEHKSALVENFGDNSTPPQPYEPEAWATRIHAIEGYADTAQKRSVPLLLSFARESQPETRTRILSALGEVAIGTKDDPCNPERFNGLSFSESNIWSRKIRQANSECETKFSAVEQARLVEGILPFLSDADGAVRTAAAIALGKIASKRATPALRRLRQDPYTVPGLEEMVGNRSVPIYSVRKAVQSALRHIQLGDGTGNDFE